MKKAILMTTSATSIAIFWGMFGGLVKVSTPSNPRVILLTAVIGAISTWWFVYLILILKWSQDEQNKD